VATLIGVVGGFAMIGLAMYLGGSAHSFVNLPGILIVLAGTFLVTTASFTLEEVARAQIVMLRAVVYHAERPDKAAFQVIDLAEQSRRKGVLTLQRRFAALAQSPFLHRAIGLVVDGLPGDEVERILSDQLKETVERHLRSAGILRRAGEVAPAMGLIGTLVGLVQMLGNLEDPAAIGPAMAVALLTTFYGAVLANMVFIPLASKLERNSQLEAMVNQIYIVGAVSISRRENPRRLEMTLNAILSPSQRVKYFD
jgi:chemotaxis protein MotA